MMSRKPRPYPIIYALLGLLAVALASGSSAAPKYKVLHGFTGGSDGGGLWGSLTLDGKGNVYGATTTTIFVLTPHSDGMWGFAVLQRFSKDGPPNGGLIFDGAGNLYGTTQICCPYGYGEVFELSPGSRGWKKKVLYHFSAKDHAGAPWDGPIMDKAENLYGTGGSAFELSPTSDGWRFTSLHEFPSFSGDGINPYAGLVMDAAGNLYGTTENGGINDCGFSDGCGTVYELSPTAGGKSKEHILHKFGHGNDGVSPALGALVIDRSGAVYGTTDIGGRLGYGTVFKLTPGSDGKWTEAILHNFTSGAGGDHASAGVVMDKSGNLYGTTIGGGSGCDCGVVYKLAPGQNGKWIYTVLHTFIGSDGAQPDANLILDDKGNLYGTTATGGPGGYGVAFELTP